MNPLTHLTMASLAFLATHYVASTSLRDVLVSVLGRTYLAMYSLVAFATLGWMIWAFYHAPFVNLPKRTYVGVLQAARNAGFDVFWMDDEWKDSYRISPVGIIDSARHIKRGMYRSATLTALSMHAAKQLPLGRGGAILTDDLAAAEWLRAARMDGRPPGAPIESTLSFGAHCPMPPDTAARGLWILSRWNDAGYDPPLLPPDDYPDLSKL